MNEEIVKKSGLVFWGLNKAGEKEYCGTQKQWQKADEMQQAHDMAVDLSKEEECPDCMENEPQKCSKHLAEALNI